MNPEHRTPQAIALLRQISLRHAPAALASSFGAEDMVLVDMIAAHALPIAIITVDTGRLPGETCELMDRVRDRHRLALGVYCPLAETVEGYVRAHGMNAFYRSAELRQSCCAIRKSEPFARARRAQRLDHRPTSVPVANTCQPGHRGVRRRPQPAKVQPASQLERRRRLELSPRA
jgi:phosphoadenosine phosphosulfate reductase